MRHIFQAKNTSNLHLPSVSLFLVACLDVTTLTPMLDLDHFREYQHLAHSIVLGYAKCFGQDISVIILQYYMFQFNETISLKRWYSILLCLFFRVIEVREGLKITEILSPKMFLIILIFPLLLVLIPPCLSQTI